MKFRTIVFEIGILLAFSLIFTIPVLSATRNMTLRLWSDHDTMLPMYDYVARYVRFNHALPVVNPMIGMDMPVLGDPVTGVLNPFLMVPLIVFGAQTGVRFIFWEVVFLSGLSMWFLAKSLGTRSAVRVWAGVIYSVSGAVVSKFAAGHMEQYFAFPAIPLIAACSLARPYTRLTMLVNATCIAFLYYTGSTYHFFYMLILFPVARICVSFVHKDTLFSLFREILSTILCVFIISFPKLFDYWLRVVPYWNRIITDPTRGSLHLPFFPLPFMVPWHVPFWGRPRIKEFLGVYQNWYEYYAYISPIPFLVLFYAQKIFRDARVKILAAIIVVAAFFIACRYPYSPFYYLYSFPVFSSFRVPQRMYVPATVFLIAFFARSFEVLQGRVRVGVVYGIMAVSILCTLPVTMHLFSIEAFEKPVSAARDIVVALRKRDPGNYYVAQMYPRIQGYLIANDIPIINFFYAWSHLNAPVYDDSNERIRNDFFVQFRPTYIIGKVGDNRYMDVGYEQVDAIGDAALFKTGSPNIFPGPLWQ